MQHIELLNYESLVEKVFPKNLFHTKMIHIIHMIIFLFSCMIKYPYKNIVLLFILAR